MKVIGKNSRKQVLGIMVDGRDLKIAHLGWQNGEIVIHALEAVTLQRRLGRLTTAKPPVVVSQEAEGNSVFGLEDEVPDGEGGFDETETEAGDVSSLLINILSKYPLKKATLAINLPEGQTSYYNFESDFNLKGKKLIKRLFAEISPLAGGTLDSAILDCFRSDLGELTVVVAEGNIALIDELAEIRSFLPRNTPIYNLIGSNEISLVNLARLNCDLPAKLISAVIYIGCDFSRVIILRGDHPISFVQTIREGYQSPQVCQTLFSKILLEQEEAGTPEIEQILLAGEIGLTHAFDFFSKQYPDAKVQSLTPGVLNTQYLKAEEIAIFPNFAIPVALAWEALEKKNPSFIKLNLMPPAIKESQKVFKVAWHGFLMLGIVFFCAVLLSYQGLLRWNQINSLQESIRLKKSSSEALQPDLAYISQIQGQVSTYRSNLSFLDSLIVDPGKWSRLFTKLSHDFQSVDHIWIEDIKSDSSGFTMIGKSLYRDRIPRLASCFPQVDLKRVTRVASEEGDIVYEFEMSAVMPSPEPGGTIGSDQPPTDQANTASDIPLAATDNTAESVSAADRQSKEEKTPYTANVQPRSMNLTESHRKYDEGLRLVRERQTTKAIAAFTSLLAQFPQCQEEPAAHYWLGECYLAEAEYESARTHFETSLRFEDNSKRPPALLQLGLTYLKMGQTAEAQEQFELLIKESPGSEFAVRAKDYLRQMAQKG